MVICCRATVGNLGLWPLFPSLALRLQCSAISGAAGCVPGKARKQGVILYCQKCCQKPLPRVIITGNLSPVDEPVLRKLSESQVVLKNN